jgi:hypothetical protein
MAPVTTTLEEPIEPPAAVAPPSERISWGAIIGGAVTALGVGALLYALGFALGLSAIDPNNPSSFRASSIFTGIWSLVTAFLALFAGGMVASRGAGVYTRGAGAIHGLVMWGLTTIAGALLVFNILTLAIGSAAALGKTAIETGANAVSGTAGQAPGLAKALGVDFNDLLAPVNRRLRAENKPQITASQLEAATKDVVGDAVRQGRLDRDVLTSSIAQKTNLSRADAEDIATRMQAAFDRTVERARVTVRGTASSLQTGALRAAEETGKAFWGVFGALLIGLISAVLGAIAGTRHRDRDIRGRGPDRGVPAVSPSGVPGTFFPRTRTNP